MSYIDRYILITFSSLPSNKFLKSSIKELLSKYPKIFCALLKSNSCPSDLLINALSNKDKASLTEPSEILTINFNTSSVALPFSKSLIFLIYSNNSLDFTLDKSNL